MASVPSVVNTQFQRCINSTGHESWFGHSEPCVVCFHDQCHPSLRPWPTEGRRCISSTGQESWFGHSESRVVSFHDQCHPAQGPWPTEGRQVSTPLGNKAGLVVQSLAWFAFMTSATQIRGYGQRKSAQTDPSNQQHNLN